MSLFSQQFWKGLAERAVKSAAQGAGLYLGALMLSAGALDLSLVEWQPLAGFAAGGALLSVVTSLGSIKVGPAGSPSLVDDQPPGAHRAAVGRE